jgi:hypothetical protein
MTAEWMLTDEEILEASQVKAYNDKGELDYDTGYLTGREQVAKAQAKKLLEYLIAHKPWVNTGTMNLIEMLKQLEVK